MKLAESGLNRCVPKLNKLKKGSESLRTLESSGLETASELAESVSQGCIELERLRQQQPHDDAKGEAARASLDEVSRMVHLVQKQVQENSDEMSRLASFEMGSTYNSVLQLSRSCLADATDDGACQALETLVMDPTLAALPACMPAKPLREYQPTDVLDTPETTEALLGQLIRWEGLCNGKMRKTAVELLTRPPPKFILDVTFAVKAATGFPPDIEGDWPDAREERLDRFRRIAEAVGEVLGAAIDFFDPADVLKGKEVATTLRLMQLLAIAAARTQPVKSATNGDAHASLTRARELPALLTAVSRCLQCAKDAVEARRKEEQTTAAAAANEELGLEAKIVEIELSLKEEEAARREQEEILAEVERLLQTSQAEVKKITIECELAGSAGARDLELEDLERQVSDLTQNAAAPEELGQDAVITIIHEQIQEVQKELAQDESSIPELEIAQKNLEEELRDSTAQARLLEAEVQRERQRREVAQELVGQSPEDQKKILRLWEERSRARIAPLEEEISTAQAEVEQRKAANLTLAQENKEFELKIEDVHLQMQIVMEEREAMREAEELLWNEKAVVDEDLEDRTQAYIHISDHLNRVQDESYDLQDRVNEISSKVAGLEVAGQ